MCRIHVAQAVMITFSDVGQVLWSTKIRSVEFGRSPDTMGATISDLFYLPERGKRDLPCTTGKF